MAGRVAGRVAGPVAGHVAPGAAFAVAAQDAPAGEGRVGQAGGLVEWPGARLTVVYAPGDSVRVAAYRAVLLSQRPLPGLPDSIPSGVRAVFAPTREVFDSLLGGRTPEWAGGVAVPSERLLVIPAWQSSLNRPEEASRVLRHEWAHLGMYQWIGALRAPRWFSEGYAEWVGGWDAFEAWKLRIMLATGGAPPLDSLDFRWPGDRASASSAYLLSATIVEYLVDQSGERGLRLLFERWRDSGSFESALRTTYGVTSGQLEEDWREWAKDRYGWLTVLSRSSVFWLVLGLMLLVMVRVRKRHRTERLAELRAGEPPEEPDFWSESGASGASGAGSEPGSESGSESDAGDAGGAGGADPERPAGGT